MAEIPDFDNLTLDPAGPEGNAWGLWNKGNELGMLNLQTPKVILEAVKEIQTGVRFSMDWGLDKPQSPSFGRTPFKHELIHKAPRPVIDDLLTFNSQCSSQWDGFKHFGNTQQMRWFNGHTLEDLKTTNALGIDGWLKPGQAGICGRGVLLDYARWAERQGKRLSHFESSPILLSDLQEIVGEIGVIFRPGDILFVRSGYCKAYEALSATDEPAIAQRKLPEFIGVEAGETTCRWLWKNQFAAVASDTPGFERCPIFGPHADPNYVLHNWCLANWGMPIGELLYLEDVAEYAQRTGRYTFFVSSAPLRVPGGAASPPNALAIF